MTWKYMGYGESGIVSRIVGKPGVTKGGQVAIITDASVCRPRAYVHRHKLHHKPTGFGKQGPNEVQMIADKIKPMIGEGGIFREHPHMTWDNFFSGDEIMDYLGGEGFSATMTCRRDRLPSGPPKDAFHHEKGAVNERNKVARFLQPITAVKTFPQSGEKKAYTRTHVTFQSTGATNLSSVNALNSNELFVVKKERGSGKEKRQWGIEMNDARLLYLKTYGRIDTIDSLIARCGVATRSRKYWHSPMNHGQCLGIVTAFGFYEECAKGKLRPESFLEKSKRMNFHQFRDRLSCQMLRYKPRYEWFPGDHLFRQTTSLSKKQRKKTYAAPNKRAQNTAASVSSGGQFCVLVEELEAAKQSKRLCGIYEPDLAEHIRTINSKLGRVNSGAKCHWCGETAWSKCTICNVPLHCFPTRGKHIGKACGLHWHNQNCFGLAWKDATALESKNGVQWSLPSRAAQQTANKEYLNELSGPL